jgi:hypothetical protein
VWKLEGKRPFGIARRIWENNIKMDLQEVGLVGHVALMGRGEVHTGFWYGDMRETDHLEEPGVYEMLILR